MRRIHTLHLLVVLVILVSTFAVATSAMAQGGGVDETQLTPEQQKELKEKAYLERQQGAAPSEPQVPPVPTLGTAAEQALTRIDPLLRDKALAGGDEQVLVWVMAAPDVNLGLYGQVLTDATDKVLGSRRVFMRVPARSLLKIAGVEGVAAVISVGPKPEPAPPDPEAPGGRVHGVALSPDDLKIDPQRAEELRQMHAQAQQVTAPPKIESPAAPEHWFEDGNQGVYATWAKGILGRGDPANPVRYAVIDTGVDFCNLALLGRWAVENAGTPYDGWPIAYDDRSAADFIANYPAGGSGYGGNWGWYVNASHEVTGTGTFTFTDILYSKVYTVPAGFSQSGTVYYGYHPDRMWHALAASGASPVVLVADPNVAGQYDTVYVDGNWDGTFDLAMDQGNPAGCVDRSGDLIPDDSYGLLYWISDGTNPLPGVDSIYGGGTPVPPAGRVVMLMINNVFERGGDHGTMCASSAAGAEPPGAFYDWAGMLPAWYPGGQIIAGPGSAGPHGPLAGAEIIPIGNTYAGGSTFNEYLFTVFGYDGSPASGDDAHIVSMSFGSGSEDADAWDFQSEYLATLNLFLEAFGVPSPIYVDSAGNGGHGYGTVNTPAPATGVSVGASTQYGPYNVWGVYEGVNGPGQANFHDVQPWSDRGPTAMSTLAPHVVANGAWGSGAIPVNLATYFNGFDGAAAWDLWGGTSRSGPVAAGMLALIYDAYWQGTGAYPDWRLARELLMNGTLDIGYDEKVAGSGQAYALRSAEVARGDYGVYVDPPYYQAGSYPLDSGQQYESFAVGMLPGETDVTTFTIYNPYTMPITVNLHDEQLLEIGRYTTTLSTNEQGFTGTNYLLGAPDYLLDLTPWITSNSTADLMIVRVAYPFDHFADDPNGAPAYKNRWIGLVYNVFDDGDGVWWDDMNANGRVEISPTVPITNHELDPDDEYIRFTYSYLRGTMQEMRVHRPAARMGSSIWLGLAHYVNDGSDTDINIEVIFYEEQDWDQVFVDPPVLTVPPGVPGTPGSAVFTATINAFARGATSYDEDFEANDGGYTHGGTNDEWQWGTPTAWPNACASGSNCWGTDLAGDYDSYSNQVLTSTLVDLSAVPAGTSLFVSWWQAWHIESSAWDHGYAEVSINGGPWTQMWAHTGGTTQQDWMQMTYDISAAAGGNVQFRWRLDSDSSVQYEGLYVDQVEVYAMSIDPPGEYMGRIIIEDPGNGTYNPHDIVVPVEKQVWFGVTVDPVIGGRPPAPTPYDNGQIYGAFSWGGRSESGDWRVFPFVVDNAPPGSVLMVDNVWEDYPTDIDTLLLDQVPNWDFALAGGPPGPYPPEWFGPHTMDDLGSGSARVGARPNWRYFTNAGTNHEFIAAPGYDGLHIMLHHAVLYGGDQTAVPFTTTVGLASISPNPVILDPGLTCVSQTFTMTFKSSMDLADGLVLGDSFGWYTPTTFISQTIYQDDPNDPSTASWVYPIHLVNSYRLDVETYNATGPDIDLFVVADNDSSGTWTAGDTVVGSSTSPSADENVSLPGLPDGDYLIAVHGWNVSPSPGTFDITILNVVGQGAMSVAGLPGSVVAGQRYTFTVHVDQSPPPGEWMGLLLFGPPLAPTAIEVPVRVDVGGAVKTAWQDQVLPGELVTYTIVLTGTSDMALAWSLEDAIPAGMEFVTVTGAVYSSTLNAILWSGALGSGSPLTETFEGSFPPRGWTVRDNAGTGNVWDRNDAFGASNRANYGSGFSAAADADAGWNGQAWDTELWSPPVLLTTTTPFSLTYASNFQDYAGNGDAWLDISVDGGATWDNLRYQTVDDPYGGTFEEENLSAYAGQMALLRWRYAATGGTAWFWHIDNVSVPSQFYDIPTHVITLTLRAVGSGLITNTADVQAGATSCPVQGSVLIAGAIPTWDKDVFINGVAYDPADSPFTVVPGDEVTIVDRVSVESDDPVTYTLVETYTASLDLVSFQSTFGAVTAGTGSISWDVTGGISNTWYVLTKTFQVNGSDWVDYITETLSLPGVPEPWIIPLEFDVPAALSKDGPDKAYPGDVITYTIVVETPDPMYPLFHTARLTDALPAGVSFADTLNATYGTAWYDAGDNAVYWVNEATSTTLVMRSAFAPAGSLQPGAEVPDAPLSDSAPAGVSMVQPGAPAHPEAVLWDQPLSTVNQNAYANQDFESTYDGYDIFIADDFTNTVPWDLDTIFVPGDTWNTGGDLSCANTFNWQIYADAGGVPDGDPWGGGALWSLTLPPTDTHVTLGTGVGGYQTNVTLTLDSPLNVPPGNWWLAFYPQMDFASCFQSGRHVADTTNGYDAVVINPGGGFGLPTTWTPITDPSTWGSAQQDAAFRLEGTVGQAAPTVVTITFQVTVTAGAGDVVTNTADLNYDGVPLSAKTTFEVPRPEWAWDKEVSINGQVVTGTNFTVVASDSVQIVDSVWITYPVEISYITLTEEWDDSLALQSWQAGSGSAVSSTKVLTWSVMPAPAGTWLVLTKTFHVEEGQWTVDRLTETLAVEGADPQPSPIVLSFNHGQACTPVTGVTLSRAGTDPIIVGEAAVFTATVTPADASSPFTYTLAPVGGTPVSVSTNPFTVSITFSQPGTQTAWIGVWNCTMTTSVTDTLDVTVYGRLYLPIVFKNY